MSKAKNFTIEKPISELINWSALNEGQETKDKIEDKTDDPILSRVSKFQSFMNKQIKEAMDSEEQEIKELIEKLFQESLSTKEKKDLEKIKQDYAEIREEISKLKDKDEIRKQLVKVEEIRNNLENFKWFVIKDPENPEKVYYLAKEDLAPDDPNNLPKGCILNENTGKYEWQWEAAISEAEKREIKVPSREEWAEIIMIISGVKWEKSGWDKIIFKWEEVYKTEEEFTKKIRDFGGLVSSTYYWSSTENVNKRSSRVQDFSSGEQSTYYKNTTGYVRCLRNF